MPFVDLSSPVQKLQGKVDDQSNVVNASNPLPSQPQTPIAVKPVDDSALKTTIVNKLKDSETNLAEKGWLKGADPANVPGQAAPQVQMNSPISQTPAQVATPPVQAKMPPLMNNVIQPATPTPVIPAQPANPPVQAPTQVVNNGEFVEKRGPALQSPVLSNIGSQSVTGADKLPPLSDIIPTQPVAAVQQAPAPVAQVAPVAPAAPVAPMQQVTPAPEAEAPKINFDPKAFVPKNASMEDYMSYTIANDASDLHIAASKKTMVRVNSELIEIPGDIPSMDRMTKLVKEILTDEQFKELDKNKEIDISYAHSSGNRFRINIYMSQGEWAAALRLIPQKIRTIAELKLPEILYGLTKIPHGLIIVAGPTGSGKSTSLAAMLQEINLNRYEHILTIEDPIEYVYPKHKSLVDQRELGKDTLSWSNALRSALRQDPNIVLVGEMRDFETIESTITVAETGHLVFATLHTNSASQTVDRIIDVFPEGQQPQIRAQLANVLSAVISQRLIPVKSGGRRALQEILIATTAVKNAIREGKTYQIDNIIQTSSEVGMQTLESGLVKLIREGEITVEEAEQHSVKVDELHALLKSN